MLTFFDTEGFANYYLTMSRYARKNQLLKDFVGVYYDINGFGLRFGHKKAIQDSWTPALKKQMKVRLIGFGHTAAATESICKAFTTWIKNDPY